MAAKKTAVDVASTSDGRQQEVFKEVFTVQYKEDPCKEYAISVLRVLGFVASNDEAGSGNLKRRVTVHVTATQLKTAEAILGIFASNVRKVPRTSAFLITLTSKSQAWQDKTRNAVKELKGVQTVKFVENNVTNNVRDKDSSVTKYKHLQMTINVVGDVDPNDVLSTLKPYGTAARIS